MTDTLKDIYSFAFKGLLTEEALDKSGRIKKRVEGLFDQDIADSLPLDQMNEEVVFAAKEMAAVYTVIAAFENSVRHFISTLLLEEVGENWWDANVSNKIKQQAEKRREEENQIKWHGQRGSDPITYVTLSDLGNIIRNNWEIFEPHVRSIEWAASIFDVLE